ncbi:unnamed protein product [Amoebophrya sp. A120]|nr:unnamed protein product [Amoebophrya sp. A120]|eukprot:GSA120T00006216001.1
MSRVTMTYSMTGLCPVILFSSPTEAFLVRVKEPTDSSNAHDHHDATASLDSRAASSHGGNSLESSLLQRRGRVARSETTIRDAVDRSFLDLEKTVAAAIAQPGDYKREDSNVGDSNLNRDDGKYDVGPHVDQRRTTRTAGDRSGRSKLLQRSAVQNGRVDKARLGGVSANTLYSDKNFTNASALSFTQEQLDLVEARVKNLTRTIDEEILSTCAEEGQQEGKPLRQASNLAPRFAQEGSCDHNAGSCAPLGGGWEVSLAGSSETTVVGNLQRASFSEGDN